MRDVRLVRQSTNTRKLKPLYDKSWALIIGINDYQNQHPQLLNARSDAFAVANMLKSDYGFNDVIPLYDSEATYSAIIKPLRNDLPNELGPDDRLVIFFAGHGTTRTAIGGRVRGYLIPYDARTNDYSTYIDMNEMSDACGFIRAKHIFLILDCCFSGISAVTRSASPLPPPKSITDAYLQEMSRRPAWQVLTAGAEDELANDGGKRPGHSVFTASLLAGLEGAADRNTDGIITASDLASFVKPEVYKETKASGGRAQTPYFNYLAGSGQGDFIFVRPNHANVKSESVHKTDSPMQKMTYLKWVGLWVLIILLAILFWEANINNLNLGSTQATWTALAVQSVPELITTTPNPTATASGAPLLTVTINAVNGVNVRHLPEGMANIIRILENGTVLPAMGRTADSQWIQVTLPDGLSGWIDAEFLVPSADIAAWPVVDASEASPVAAPGAASATEEPAITTVTAEVVPFFLPVYSGPSPESEAAARSPRGTDFDVIGQITDGSWLQVTTPDGIVGWVEAGEVRINGDVSSVPVVE